MFESDNLYPINIFYVDNKNDGYSLKAIERNIAVIRLNL
jgi:hypothetical protein